LESHIKEKIGTQKLNAKLATEKIESFYSTTNKLITAAFSDYNEILQPYSFDDSSNLDLKVTINGARTLMSKSAFTEGDVPVLYYDSVFASQVVDQKIKRFIPISFSILSTKRYLLSKADLVLAFEKIVQNPDEVIICFNAEFDVREIIEKSRFKSVTVYVPSTEYQFSNILFVLRKGDLPSIKHTAIKEEEIQKQQLIKVNDVLKIYASVIDINTESNKYVKDEWRVEVERDASDLHVQLTIAFLCGIYWKKNIDVIQIDVASEFKEQGIQNSINDVTALQKSTEDKK
jgi:hypothetical protein